MQSPYSNKSIHTLIPDIYHLVGKKTGWFNDVLASELGHEISLKVQQRFAPIERKPSLRLSQMGDTCPCALWHSIHHPELAEAFPGWAQIKFMYGDLVESMIIALAKAAGHTVEGEQDAVSVDGIVGHRDCVIDGCLVDVKSANSRSFQKFKSKELATDPFSSAYLDQLDGYLVGSADDPIVRQKDRGFLLGVDKNLGHMALYQHELRPTRIRERIKEAKRIVELPSPPRCTCGTVPEGKSGNIRLDLKASYNNFKFCCFPNVRKFIYANGPVYLTKVVRLPDVMEEDRYGRIISLGEGSDYSPD